jgi:plastocyanin
VLRRAAVLAFVFAVIAAPAASADEQISARPTNTYVNPNVTIDQGERLTFSNTDVDEHSVTARQEGTVNGSLFDTGLIGTNEEKFVEGSQYLTTGAYEYFCSIHANMTGTLNVTAAGTPVPRPGSAGDKTPADVTVSIYKRTLDRIVKTKRLPVKVTLNEAADVKLVAKLGRRTIAKGEDELEQGTDKVNLRLTRSGKRRLRNRDRARIKVTVDATDKAGNESSDDVKRTLKD